jgi:tetratricopeptide (TPR) repeat protein
VRGLLAVCGRGAADALPPVFPVAGGFVVLGEKAPTPLPPRAVRLRRLSENCYLPVDADLVPELLPEEAIDLTRRRGLVFLPDGRCLAFRPDEPLPAEALLRVPVPRREEWRPFPDGPGLAERLTVITRVVPEITADDVLGPGGAGVGEEPPERPPAVGTLKSAAGRAAFGVGKGLAALGRVLGIGALARLGAGMMGAAAAAVPRLSEALLGKQEAALRELLRKFREGRTEEALRNALPVGGDAAASVNTGDQLPTHDVRWSLAGIAGAGGPGGAWVVGPDVQRELTSEYRKAAQVALARGDYRRAAFIYAKLLRELSTAADVLSKGGLHRDAAILYRDLLRQPRWAAREFEAAGEWDEALRLYRQAGEHELAGDLLRRIGEEEQAIEEYHRAARQLAEGRRDYAAAGELMLRKTGRDDLALSYFAGGWRERQLLCALRLAELLADAEPFELFWKHFDEVEDWLASSANVSGAANFFNAAARIADRPHLAGRRAELRDRTRLALAATARQVTGNERRAGNLVSELFGAPGLWVAAVVADAGFALRSKWKARQAPAAAPTVTTVRLANGTVTAVAFAPESEDVFVGLESGEVFSYRPRTGETALVSYPWPEPVEALAVDAAGRYVIAASRVAPEFEKVRLRSFRRNESGQTEYHAERDYHLLVPGWYHLNPLVWASGARPLTLLSTPAGVVEFAATVLIPREPTPKEGEEVGPCYLILPDADRRLVVTERDVLWRGETVNTGWKVENGPLAQPTVAWLWGSADHFEYARISAGDVVAWSEVRRSGDEAAGARTLSAHRPEGFRAVALWKPGMLVAVTSANRVCWLRAGRLGLQEWAKATEIAVPARAVACFPSRATGEAVVLLADGTAARIPVPV